MGLLSPGGVHSHQDHIAALAGVLAREGVPVAVHAFTDGRDVPPQSAKDQLAEFMADVHEMAGVEVATVIGRYYAMDRDKRWDRVAKAYAAMTKGEGERAADPMQAIEQSYATGKHDEFILPTVIGDYAGIKDGDAILMANYRADRAREILAAYCRQGFRRLPGRRRAQAGRRGRHGRIFVGAGQADDHHLSAEIPDQGAGRSGQ